MSESVEGRHVLVTGGARGIGRAIAQAFHDAGDRVSLFDVLEEPLSKAAAELRGLPCQVDVSDSNAVHNAVEMLEREVGPIDVLVNNAGINSRFTVEETDEAEWDRVMGVNVKGVFNCCHAVIGGMRVRGRGSIINVGSLFSRQAWPKRAAYCASKAAVQQFTRCFALEVAPDGITVLGVSPGIMESDMTAGSLASEAFQREFMTRVSRGAVGEPARDLAGVVLFLASPTAGYMTGEVVEVHGGFF